MVIRVGINGFGRIGRLLARIIYCLDSELDINIELVAINHPRVDINQLKYLFEYDSVHGRWTKDNKNTIEIIDNELFINKKLVNVFNESDPKNIEWDSVNVDYVIESSGHFTTQIEASKHLTNNKRIKCVIVSAASSDIPMFVMGVNNDKYNNEKIISNASCSTNCLAPLVKIIHENYGIKEGLMTTIHAATASQRTVDGTSKKDWRGGRSVLNNIIPSTTGAAKAVGKLIPDLEGKLTGMAFRVPVSDASVIDLTLKLKTNTSLDNICKTIANDKDYDNGLFKITEDEVVSSDIIGESASFILDKKSSIKLNESFFKIIAWYDNEWGYCNRLIDLMVYINKKMKTD